MYIIIDLDDSQSLREGQSITHLSPQLILIESKKTNIVIRL